MATECTLSQVPHFILTADGELLGVDTPGNRELVRRIHACFEACADIPTADLEQGIVRDMQRVIGQVIPVLEAHGLLAPLPAAAPAGTPAIPLAVETVERRAA